jgi:hypothetical protein
MKITIPRELLLVEIERRCHDAACNARTRIGLTKEEAHAYNGFKCERCERHWDNLLTERDVPEWWEELTVTDLYAVRESQDAGQDEPSEAVTRLSENFRRARRIDETGEDSF